MFPELLEQHARTEPAKAALIAGQTTLTYQELVHAMDGIAQWLLDRGLKPGDRIALHRHNSIELVVLMFAGFRAGLIAVPINPRLKAAEIAYVLDHSGARLCFSEPAFAGLVTTIEVVTELPSFTSASFAGPECNPDAPAILLYTSGTTAQPKGVIHSQRTLYEGAAELARNSVDPGDTVLCATQISHIGGLGVVLLPALIHGATIVLLGTFQPAAALEAIEQHGCTFMFLLPALLQQLVEEQAAHPRNVQSVRAFLIGGDMVPLSLQQRASDLFHAEVLEGYAMTELLPIAINTKGAARVGSLGPGANAIICILDANGEAMAPGEVGELVVRSPASCSGYWQNPKATAELFAGGWLHTGDLASADADGYHWFKGRLKQIIIRGGCNISPQEVEEAFYRHPAVLESGVVGMPDAVFGEVPVAFLSLREGQEASADELLAFTRTLLSDYKVPVKIEFMDVLPKGLTGKIDRRRLRDLLLASEEALEASKAVPV